MQKPVCWEEFTVACSSHLLWTGSKSGPTGDLTAGWWARVVRLIVSAGVRGEVHGEACEVLEDDTSITELLGGMASCW